MRNVPARTAPNSPMEWDFCPGQAPPSPAAPQHPHRGVWAAHQPPGPLRRANSILTSSPLQSAQLGHFGDIPTPSHPRAGVWHKGTTSAPHPSLPCGVPLKHSDVPGVPQSTAMSPGSLGACSMHTALQAGGEQRAGGWMDTAGAKPGPGPAHRAPAHGRAAGRAPRAHPMSQGGIGPAPREGGMKREWRKGRIQPSSPRSQAAGLGCLQRQNHHVSAQKSRWVSGSAAGGRAEEHWGTHGSQQGQSHLGPCQTSPGDADTQQDTPVPPARLL